MAARSRPTSTSIAELLEHPPRLSGLGVARLSIGDAAVVVTECPAAFVVSAHGHDTDYVEVFLDGRLRIGRAWFRAGDVRIVPAGTVYGPLRSGPDGATTLQVYAGGSVQPIPPRSDAKLAFGSAPGAGGTVSGTR